MTEHQPQTFLGKRGLTEVRDIEMRQVYRIVRDRLEYMGPDPDFDAVCQNVCCEIEKAMGIYPNVPDLKPEPDNLGPCTGGHPPMTHDSKTFELEELARAARLAEAEEIFRLFNPLLDEPLRSGLVAHIAAHKAADT